MAVTTTEGGYFPNTDITHKPKRYQNQVADEIASVATVKGDTIDINLGVPQSVTLESAISYYTSHATGQNAHLYNRTAQWLKELLKLRQRNKEVAKEAAKEAAQPVLKSAK